MNEGTTAFDQINSFFGNVNNALGNAFDTASLFVGNLAAFEQAKAEREAAKYLNSYGQGNAASDYYSGAGTSNWGNVPQNQGVDPKIVQYGLLGLGVLVIYKIVK